MLLLHSLDNEAGHDDETSVSASADNAAKKSYVVAGAFGVNEHRQS